MAGKSRYSLPLTDGTTVEVDLPPGASIRHIQAEIDRAVRERDAKAQKDWASSVSSGVSAASKAPATATPEAIRSALGMQPSKSVLSFAKPDTASRYPAAPLRAPQLTDNTTSELSQGTITSTPRNNSNLPVGRLLKAGVGDIVEGAGSLYGLPANAVAALTGADVFENNIGEDWRNALGLGERGGAGAEMANQFGIQSLIGAGAARAALPFLGPTGSAVAEGLGANEPILEGIAGGGAGLTTKLAEEAGLPWWAQLGVGLAGGVGTYGAAKGAARVATDPRTKYTIQAALADNAGMLIGPGGRNSDLIAYQQAKDMANAGHSPEEIKAATKWEQSPFDGKWRRPIADTGLTYDHAALSALKPGQAVAYDQIFRHPGWEDEYPGLGDRLGRKLKVAPTPPGNTRLSGSYDPATHTLFLNPLKTDDEILDTIIHEGTHGVQSSMDIKYNEGGSTVPGLEFREGPSYDRVEKQIQNVLSTFPPGYQPTGKLKQDIDDFRTAGGEYEYYRRRPGEAEAENFAGRRDFTQEMQDEIPLSWTSEYAWHEQDPLGLEFPGAPKHGTSNPSLAPPFVDAPPGLDASTGGTLPSSLTPKDTFTPYLDENGQPLDLYHGGEDQIHEMKSDWYGDDRGMNMFPNSFFLTPDREMAATYGDQITKANAQIRNPYIVDSTEKWEFLERFEDPAPELKRQGYDGAIIKADDGGPDEYVIFDPPQFKRLGAASEMPPELPSSLTSEDTLGVNPSRIIYRGTTGGDQRISGGISEGLPFAAADEKTARLYGDQIEQIGVKPEARILKEGTAEFRRVTGRRGARLIRSMRPGENMATAGSDAVEKAKAAGYDAVEFESGENGIAIINEDAFLRNWEGPPEVPGPLKRPPDDMSALYPDDPFKPIKLRPMPPAPQTSSTITLGGTKKLPDFELGYENPLNWRERVVEGGGVEIRPFGGNWHIAGIRAVEPGGGRRAMEAVIREADRLGVTLDLTAEPLDSMVGKKMSKKELVDWYKQFGFTGRADNMVRKPQGGGKMASLEPPEVPNALAGMEPEPSHLKPNFDPAMMALAEKMQAEGRTAKEILDATGMELDTQPNALAGMAPEPTAVPAGGIEMHDPAPPVPELKPEDILAKAAGDKDPEEGFTQWREAHDSGPGTLFDYSNLDQVPNVPQVPMQRYDPKRGASPRITDALLDPRVEEGINRYVLRGAALGGKNWYNTDQFRQKFVDVHGEKEGGERYARFMDTIAATSPRSKVPDNIRTGSYFNYLREQGLPINEEMDIAKGYGSVAQALHRGNTEKLVAGGGWDIFKNPKPASFSTNLQGNQENATIDTHNFRLPGILSRDPRFLMTSITEETKKTVEEAKALLAKQYPGLPSQIIDSAVKLKPDKLNKKTGEMEPGKVSITYRPQQWFNEGFFTMDEAVNDPALWVSKPNANEYKHYEDWQRVQAKKLGMTPAQYQASMWVGAGEATGLGSPPEPFLRTLEARIKYTAHRMGTTPEAVIDGVVKGKIPLLELGAAVAGGSVLSGMQQEREPQGRPAL